MNIVELYLITTVIFVSVIYAFQLFLYVYATKRSSLLREAKKYLGKNLGVEPLITLIIPMYKESEIISITLNSVSRLRYPKEKLQVILALEPDDLDTIETLKRVCKVIKEEQNLPRLIMFRNLPIEIAYNNEPRIKNKPSALNEAIKIARGDIVAIYDAEDIPHPEHPLIAASILSNNSVVAIQFTRAIDNYSDNILTKAQSIEFHIWYNYLEPTIAKLMNSAVIAGSGYYIKRNILENLNFWNSKSPTEDLDLTFKLIANGHKIVLIDVPVKTQGIPFFKFLLSQRSRWIRGALLTIPSAIRALPYSIPLAIITILLPISSIVVQSWPMVSLFINNQLAHIFIVPLVLSISSYVLIYRLLNPRSFSYLLLITLIALINALAVWIAIIELIIHPYKWNKTVHVKR